MTKTSMKPPLIANVRQSIARAEKCSGLSLPGALRRFNEDIISGCCQYGQGGGIDTEAVHHGPVVTIAKFIGRDSCLAGSITRRSNAGLGQILRGQCARSPGNDEG
jgi:hypothetical protein